jgi:hypothetical protein
MATVARACTECSQNCRSSSLGRAHPVRCPGGPDPCQAFRRARAGAVEAAEAEFETAAAEVDPSSRSTVGVQQIDGLERFDQNRRDICADLIIEGCGHSLRSAVR